MFQWIAKLLGRVSTADMAKRELVEIEAHLYESERHLQQLQTRIAYYRKRQQHLRVLWARGVPTLTQEVVPLAWPDVQSAEEQVSSLLRRAAEPRPTITRLKPLGKGLSGRKP